MCEAKTEKSLVDEQPVVELKVLPPHLEYEFLEGDDKLPVIIKKDLSVEEKTVLITVLKSHNNPSSNPTPSTNLNTKGRNHRRSKQRIENFNLKGLSPPIVTMADQRTMAQLLETPTEGYEDAIVIPAITADNFEPEDGLLTLVQNKQFFGHDKEDPHAHVRYFNKITSTLKFPNVSNTSIKLWIFPFSLEDQDSLNSAAGGNFLDKMPYECLAIIESKSKVCYSHNKPIVDKVSMNTSTSGISPDVAEHKDIVKALLLDKKSQSPAPVKAVEESCVTCGVYVKANDVVIRNMQTQGQNMQNQLTNLTDLITKFVNSNSASTSSLGTLPSNIIANPRSDLKAITTQSGVSYDGPQIPPLTSFLPKVVENKPEAIKDTPAIAPVSASKPNLKTSIPYPSRRNDERNHEKANNQIEKFYQIFKDMSFEISFADALILMPKFASTLKALIRNKEKLSEMARTPLNEHCSAVLLKKLPKKLGDPCKFLIPCDFPGMAECLALADLGANINLMPFSVCKRLSLPDLTPRCMTLELADHSISHPVGVAKDVYVKVGSFHFSADFIVVDFDVDPRVPLILKRSFLKTGRVLIDVFEEVDAFLAIKDDPTSFEFWQLYLDPEGDILILEAFLNDDPLLPPPNQRNYMPEVRTELKICEAKSDKSLVDEPLEVELKDLPLHLEYAFLEADDKLPIIIAKDLSVEEKTALIMVLKSHKRAIAWKLSDIKGIDPEFCTHKILMEEDFEPADQGKTTFTCPYGTFAYRRMPFGLCNAPCTFQRCMMAIFHDMIKKTMEVFMDDFSVFENSFQSCLSHLESMLKRCEDTNLCLNWEKSHFMVKEGIVPSHKISKQGIEVDKEKVDSREDDGESWVGWRVAGRVRRNDCRVLLGKSGGGLWEDGRVMEWSREYGKWSCGECQEKGSMNRVLKANGEGICWGRVVKVVGSSVK
nr:reverse transcriptase domain-containing protein [Tanacetum cinerariifolium]